MASSPKPWIAAEYKKYSTLDVTSCPLLGCPIVDGALSTLTVVIALTIKKKEGSC